MNVVLHRFTSPKTDGADATQIQPSHWNDGHAFVGGAAGDVLTRDPTDATFGAVWQSPGASTTLASSGWALLPPERAAYLVILAAAVAIDFHGAEPETGSFTIGARLKVINHGTAPAALVHVSGAVAVGKLVNWTTGARATQIKGVEFAQGGSAEYVWDGSYWRIASHEQGGAIGLALSNSNFVGFTAAPAVQDFYLHGVDAHLRFYFAPATLPAAAALQIVGLPFTFHASTQHLFPIIANYTPAHAGWGVGFATIAATLDAINLLPQSLGQWPAGDIYISVDLIVPIK